VRGLPTAHSPTQRLKPHPPTNATLMEENPTHITPQTQAQPTSATPIHTPSVGPLLLTLSLPPQLRPLFKKSSVGAILQTDPAQMSPKRTRPGLPQWLQGAGIWSSSYLGSFWMSSAEVEFKRHWLQHQGAP
jgi:hypothetical protein